MREIIQPNHNALPFLLTPPVPNHRALMCRIWMGFNLLPMTTATTTMYVCDMVFFFTKVYFWLLRVWYWFHFDSLTLKVFILVPYVCLGFKRLLSSKSVNGWAAKWLSGTLQYWQDNFILNTHTHTQVVIWHTTILTGQFYFKHTHTHLLVSGMGAWGVLETAVWVSHWIYRCPWGMKTRSIWLAYILIVIGKLY